MTPEVGKACWIDVDRGDVFHVQFNPNALAIQERAVWTPSEEHETDRPPLRYEKGTASKLSCDLVFDTTDDGSDVGRCWVDPLREFLRCGIDGVGEEGGALARPPYATFEWGPFRFEGVIESLEVSLIFFSRNGTPLRAKVKVHMLERPPEVRAAGRVGTGPTWIEPAEPMVGPVTTTGRPGETLLDVSVRTGRSVDDLAKVSGVSDPEAEVGGVGFGAAP